MEIWVLTEGWYSDLVIKAVTTSEASAQAWVDSGDTRDYYGPFAPDSTPSEQGSVKND